MKALATLNRVRQWQVDEIQRDIARLLGDQQGYQDNLKALDEEVVREQNLVDSQPEHGRLLLNRNEYFEHAQTRRKEFLEKITQLQKTIDHKREVLFERYRALKTAELLLKKHQEQEKKTQQDAENRILDEIGSQQSLRRR